MKKIRFCGLLLCLLILPAALSHAQVMPGSAGPVGGLPTGGAPIGGLPTGGGPMSGSPMGGSATGAAPQVAEPLKVAPIIAGRVVNGTNNNAPAPGVAVQITRPGFDREPTVVLATTKTDAKGHFSVQAIGARRDDLLTARIAQPGFTYEIPAYDGAGQLKSFGVTDLKSGALNLTVFESTSTPPPLTFTVHHVAISTEDRQLKCIERIVVENPSLRTYIGQAPQNVTVNLALPAGAQDVELDPKIHGGKLVKNGDQYGVALPITPQIYDNRNAIIINYTMPWKRGGVDLSRKLLYPVRFFFMAREEKDKNLIITAPDLKPDEIQQIPVDGRTESRIVNVKGPGQDVPVFTAGTLVSMNVARPTNPLVWAFVAFVGALCLVVPLTFVRSRPSNNAEATGLLDIRPNSPEPPVGQSVIHRHYDGAFIASSVNSGLYPGVGQPGPALQECIEAMAKLDDEWQDGTIARVMYQEQRAAWKSKALHLLDTEI